MARRDIFDDPSLKPTLGAKLGLAFFGAWFLGQSALILAPSFSEAASDITSLENVSVPSVAQKIQP